MSGCDEKIYRENFESGTPNYSSQVTYDGVSFDCIEIPEGSGLNAVLQLLGNKICSITVPETAAQLVKTTGLGSWANLINTLSCFSGYNSNQFLDSFLYDFANQFCALKSTVNGLGTVPSVIADLDIGDPLHTSINALSCFTGFTADQSADALILAMATTICQNESCCQQTKDLLADLWNEVYNGDESDGADHDGDVVIDHGGTATPTPAGLTVNLANPTNPNENQYMVAGTIVSVDDGDVSLTATRDNYVDVTSAGTYIVTAVTIGAPAPALSGLRLYKFATDGSGVTATEDLRNYYFFNGTQFADNSIGTRHIVDGNVTKAKLADNITAGVLGDAAFLRIVYDAKGMITGTTGDINIVGLADGDVLRYVASSGRWENFALGAIALPAAVADQTVYYNGSAYAASNLIKNNGSHVGFGFGSSDTLAASFLFNHSTSFGTSIKPPVPSLSASSGGSLAASTTYYYSVQFVGANGLTYPAVEYSQATDASNRTIDIDLNWPKGAVSCRVFRSTTSGTYTEFHDPGVQDSISDDGGLLFTAGALNVTKHETYGMEVSYQGVFMGVQPSDDYLINMVNYCSDVVTGWRLKHAPLSAVSDVFGVKIEVDPTNANYNLGAHLKVANSSLDNIALWIESGRMIVGSTYASGVRSAAIELRDTDKGFLWNRLTTLQRDSLASTLSTNDDGLTIYNTNEKRIEHWTGSAFTQPMSETWTVIRTTTSIASIQDRDVIVADATSGSLTFGLPPVATSKGFVVILIKEDASANAVTYDAAGSETISGNLTLSTTTQWESIKLFCDGTQWLTVS